MHILIRLDLNVSIDNGVVKDNSRILACKQTIDHYKKQAKLCVLSHLGRPDGITEQLSLKNLIPETPDPDTRDPEPRALNLEP